MNSYPIISVQIIDHQVDQMHELNIISVKMLFSQLRNLNFRISPYGIIFIFTWTLLKK